MFDENKVCPYTGLRPFSEDESLYFKGRDEHIEQATKQLGRNKFLILTGASGDGKSSLVYAGIVPNARAGFLKSTFSNWAVADFRPERNPFHNLCKSIALQLGIASVDTVKAELSHGFSALADLYKASPLYYDEREAGTDDARKNEHKRKAANLLILADQFEEFFTNPENYQKGVPSVEATLVTNLLLETAQLALEENLPIYVVVTMRSDFIGQCAAFRGLPEYIGFSQFFVPRLNRRQLQEVIEEPAVSNGDRIARRLTERLIHDMVEGTDQLPILQHALNQIWKMAGDGKDEMDLIHYAMVGGMEGKDLPAEDVVKFTGWFKGLPENVRNCYDRPDLQNVLNTHANKLLYQASENQKEDAVAFGDVQKIVETTFKCLTKIDNGRAVRNRMTLDEITAILAQPQIDHATVQRVLDIFREPGNTLLKPYISDNPESKELRAGTILDITHESLIRNWEHLGQWAREEYNNYSIFLDFQQQLNRWTASGRSGSFLLYIGPLTYFENWFATARPNAAWIARYLQEEAVSGQKEVNSRKILDDSHEFLRRSARKHMVTRAVVRYGPRRIAAGLILLALLVFSSFTAKNYVERQNGYVLSSIKEDMFRIVNGRKASIITKSNLLLEALNAGQTDLKEIEARVVDPIEKVNIILGVVSNFVIWTQTASVPSPEIVQGILLVDSLLDSNPLPHDHVRLERLLNEINDFSAALELRYYYSEDSMVHRMLLKNCKRSGKWVTHILKNQPAGFTRTTELNVALEHALSRAQIPVEEVNALLAILSPFEAASTPWLAKVYGRDKIDARGLQHQYGTRFHGLYQELANLYSAKGNTAMVLQCVDTLLKYNQNYFMGDYSNVADNAGNMVPYFFVYGHRAAIRPFATGYCKRKNMPEDEFFDRLVARCQLGPQAASTLEAADLRNTRLPHDTNLEFGSPEMVKFLFDNHREVINNSDENKDRKLLNLAVSFKMEGLYYAKRRSDAGKETDPVLLRETFNKAMEYYNKVSPGFLEETMVYVIDRFKNKALFIFPDYFTRFHPWEPRTLFDSYASVEFMDYILNENLFDRLYTDDSDFKLIEWWVEGYSTSMGFSAWFCDQPAKKGFLKKLLNNLQQRKADKWIDMNTLKMWVGREDFRAGHADLGVESYSAVKTETIDPFLKISQGPFIFSQIAIPIADLMVNGQTEKGMNLIRSIGQPSNRGSLYAFVARELSRAGKDKIIIEALLDSCRTEINRDLTQSNWARVQLIHTLALKGDPGDLEEAGRLMKNLEAKDNATTGICRWRAYRNELYEAAKAIPENSSDDNRAQYLEQIMNGRAAADKPRTPFWEKYGASTWKWRQELLFYQNE